MNPKTPTKPTLAGRPSKAPTIRASFSVRQLSGRLPREKLVLAAVNDSDDYQVVSLEDRVLGGGFAVFRGFHLAIYIS